MQLYINIMQLIIGYAEHIKTRSVTSKIFAVYLLYAATSQGWKIAENPFQFGREGNLHNAAI